MTPADLTAAAPQMPSIAQDLRQRVQARLVIAQLQGGQWQLLFVSRRAA
jgi:hypothetical protein